MDTKPEQVKLSKKKWFITYTIDWLSDWFGLFDIAIGIITFTKYYPATQSWFLNTSYTLLIKKGE